MDSPAASMPAPPKKPISLGAFLAQKEAAEAAAAEKAEAAAAEAAAEEARAHEAAQAPTASKSSNKAPSEEPTTTSTKQPASKKRKAPAAKPAAAPATKKRKAPSKPSASAPKKRSKRNPTPNKPQSSVNNKNEKVYIVRAIEGWRSPASTPPSSSEDDTAREGEGKLDVPILGVYRDAERALREAHAWLQGRCPAEYEFVREERVVMRSAGQEGEEGGEGEDGGEEEEVGWEMEMLTGRDDGIVFVSVEGWVVE
ncbi:MAG: hypothetical protein Q9207_004840 [Kuettlingeria erythrocarpa]